MTPILLLLPVRQKGVVSIINYMTCRWLDRRAPLTYFGGRAVRRKDAGQFEISVVSKTRHQMSEFNEISTHHCQCSHFKFPVTTGFVETSQRGHNFLAKMFTTVILNPHSIVVFYLFICFLIIRGNRVDGWCTYTLFVVEIILLLGSFIVDLVKNTRSASLKTLTDNNQDTWPKQILTMTPVKDVLA